MAARPVVLDDDMPDLAGPEPIALVQRAVEDDAFL
jgi:hypothetical protein